MNVRELDQRLLTTAIIARFWAKVAIDPDDGACWVWTACLDPDGYGRFRLAGKKWLAHRIAWTLAFGRIQDGLLICHKCDNPRCVNHTHLFLGTVADNVRDRVAKGRSRGRLSVSTVQSPP